jgi:hypothetical protein
VTTRGKPWIGRVGFATGAVLAAAIVVAGSVPAGGRPLAAGVKLEATATGGIAVAPEGRVLAARRLAPGTRPAHGRVELLNQTSRRATVLVRARSNERPLDSLVRVELRPGHGSPLRTTLAGLRRWRPVGPALAAHRRKRLDVRLSIPGSAPGGHEGRHADVTLEFIRRGAQS